MTDMNINGISPYENLSFRARKSDIRKADDIQRRAVQEFPMLSASRAKIFYTSSKEDAPHSKKTNRLINDLSEKISVMRFLSGLSENAKGLALVPKLQAVKKYKCGNCSESALVALAALRANGYSDSGNTDLCLNSKIINEKTGKIIDEKTFDMDHRFVTTSMGKYSSNPKDIVVVDPWAGFTESYSGAVDKYKSIYSDKIKNFEKRHLEKFNKNNNRKFSLFPKNKYAVRSKLVFLPAETASEYDYSRLGAYVQIMYPEIIMPEHRNKNKSNF